ncbi:MAG: cytidylate kinase-like family protein [Myxococcales bacterium]|nr:cytidylate kinase-like family protein [Myxococcales bacterium]
MVEAQIRRWRAQEEARSREAEPAPPAPLLTISRQYGSQGAAIGRSVADALGLSFWDRELVHAIAVNSGISEQLVASLDEHRRSKLEDFIDEILMGHQATERHYIAQLHRVLRTIGSHGGALIVGRGAHFALDDRAHLSVRVIAPEASRISRIASQAGLPEGVVLPKVREVEKERQAFVRTYFGRDVEDANEYDLVLNSARLGLELAAEIIIAAYRGRR